MTEIRILVVDDEPDIREVVDVALSLDPAFKIRSCGSGADALGVAAQWSPALILLDVMMPLMDGPATFANLRKNPRTADIPIVFLTARTQADEVRQYISLGALAVVSKPFNPMTLAAELRHYLAAVPVRSVP